MVMLGDFRGTRNNFTILRLLLALAVLFGHSFPITGHGRDPLSMLIAPYPWIGHLAVSGFFAISGFLVTASFVKRGALIYTASRVLRLYPAIIVYCLAAILVIGPLASDVPVAQYFQSHPWSTLSNAGLWEWKHPLPHAFTHNPLPGSSNGSTWTVQAELRCYIAILFLGFFGMLESRTRANVALVALLYWIRENFASIPILSGSGQAWWIDPIQFFLVGSLMWINRKQIPLNWGLGVVALIAPLFGMRYGFMTASFTIGWSYLVLLLAYRTPYVNLDRYGDISYGVYIYAWPIQQLLWRPGQSGYMNALLAFLVVIPVASLSWFLVEKPALDLRRHLETRKVPAKVADRDDALRSTAGLEKTT